MPITMKKMTGFVAFASAFALCFALATEIQNGERDGLVVRVVE